MMDEPIVRTWDAVGIANLLPLDYLFLLDQNAPASAIKRSLEGLALPVSEPPNVPFEYTAYSCGGGGRIANILTFLGANGHQVCAVGTVGSDRVGDIVVADLTRHSVDITQVVRPTGKTTPVVFIVYQAGRHLSEQIQRQPQRVVTHSFPRDFTPPDSKFLIIGRSNDAALAHARSRATSPNRKLSVHLSTFPTTGRATEGKRDWLQLADIVVTPEETYRRLASRLQVRLDDPRDLLEYTAAELIVVFAQDNFRAAHRRTGQVLERTIATDYPLTDPTGMLDAFHAGLISYLTKTKSEIDDVDAVQRALDYGMLAAAVTGSRMGARGYPVGSEAEALLERVNSGLRTVGARPQPIAYSPCFISYCRADHTFAEELYGDLSSRGVPSWLSPLEVGGGLVLNQQIVDAIGAHERLVIVLSEASLASSRMCDELGEARRRESRQKRKILFPVRLTSQEAIERWQCSDSGDGQNLVASLRARPIVDFTGWEDRTTHWTALKRLLDDIRHP